MVKALLLAGVFCLLTGCPGQPKVNVACASLSKSDIEAAIPGVPFREGEPSMTTDDDYDHMSSSCHFHTVSENRWMLVNIEIYDGVKQAKTIQQLRQEGERNQSIDVHELKGLGDGAIWYVYPAGYKHGKAFNLDVLRGGNQYARFNIDGIGDDAAEPVLTRLAVLALARYEKTTK